MAVRNRKVPRVYSSPSRSGDTSPPLLGEPLENVEVGTCEWRLLCVSEKGDGDVGACAVTRGEEGWGWRSISSRMSASRRRRSERLGVGGRGPVVFVGDGGW